MWFIPLYSFCLLSVVVVAVVENLTVQKKKRQTKGGQFRGVHQLSCSALLKYWASDTDYNFIFRMLGNVTIAVK